MNVYFAKRLERIDGLINQNDLESFKQLVETISNNVERDGFRDGLNSIDVKVYLQRALEEMLNK
jgi:hypothetical protein